MKISTESPSTPTYLKNPSTTSNPTPPQTPIGTLWSLSNSPFSAVVNIVIALSGTRALTLPFTPVLTPFTMFFRLGPLSAFRRKKITAPVLRTHDEHPRYICDSFDIAMYVDTKRQRGKPSLFPSEHLTTIANFNHKAGLLNSYLRAQVIQRLRNDSDAAAQIFAPRALRNKFVTKPIVSLGLWLFSRKYRHESRVATRDVAKAVLNDVRAALAQHKGKHLRYICAGTLTYADVVVAESLGFDPQRDGEIAYLCKDDEFAESFPDLVAWARAIRETHYLGIEGSEKGGERGQ